jgi:hypothetical protein
MQTEESNRVVMGGKRKGKEIMKERTKERRKEREYVNICLYR